MGMSPAEEVDYILNDCFLAVGQAIGKGRRLDADTIVWWHDRYRDAFLRAMLRTNNSWRADRHRVTAVGRFLGLRALHYAGDRRTIDVACAEKAALDVESGCQMQAQQDRANDG